MKKVSLLSCFEFAYIIIIQYKTKLKPDFFKVYFAFNSKHICKHNYIWVLILMHPYGTFLSLVIASLDALMSSFF